MEQSQCCLVAHAMLNPVHRHVLFKGMMHVLFVVGVRPDLGV